MSLFRREPVAVLGTLVTVLVAAFAKWRGLEVEEVLAQVAALGATFAVIRAKVTPFIEGAVGRVKRYTEPGENRDF